MCVALLATLTTSTQRSSALNLALLPLYVGGIVGPAIGAALSVFGLRVVFLAAAFPPAVGALVARTIVAPRREAREAEAHRASPGER
jgi:MFS family permease